MSYVAILTLDYTQQHSNEYQRLLNALCQCGWKYAETSALFYKEQNLNGVRRALEVLARALETPGGRLSTLSLQVQWVVDSRRPPAEGNHARALQRLLREALPSEFYLSG